MALVACPKCEAKLRISATNAASVRCPKCKTLISPDGTSVPKSKQAAKTAPAFEVVDDEPEDEQEEDRPRKKAKARVQEDDEDDEPASRKKRRDRDDDDDEDDDEEDRPRKAKKKSGKKSNRLLIILSCVFGGLAIAGVGGYFAVRAISDSLAFRGDWPEGRGAQGFAAGSDSVTLHVLGVEDRETVDLINQQIDEIVPVDGPLVGHFSSFKAPRLTVIVSPVKNPEEFAKKIEFGTVHSVKGNIINVRSRKLSKEEQPPPPDPFETALRNLNSKDVGRRLITVTQIGDITPPERRAEAMRALEPMLDDPEESVQHRATGAFCEWATKENVPALLKLLQREKVGGPKYMAMKCLARLRDERGLVIIGEWLFQNDKINYVAQEVLIDYGPMAEDVALKYLMNPNHEARQAGLNVLGRVGGPRSYEPVAALLADEKNCHTAGDALKSFGKGAEDEVVKMLGHADAGTRDRACKVLEKIGTSKSIPALEQATMDSNNFVKNSAKSAIHEIKMRQEMQGKSQRI
jgi:hypothetical protein